MVIAEPPLPLFDIIFKVGITPGDLNNPLDRLPAERRTAQVRVENDTGRIDHPAESVGTISLDDLCSLIVCLIRRRQAKRFALLLDDPRPKRLNNRPARLLHDLLWKPGKSLPLFDSKHHLIDLRKILQHFPFVIVHTHPFRSRSCWYLYRREDGKTMNPWLLSLQYFYPVFLITFNFLT